MRRRPDDVNIKVRKINIGFEESLPTSWFPVNGAAQMMCDVISLLFPAGERFFIDSVRHYRSRITDPELQRDVAGFIAQESMHTQQHLKCNGLLKNHSKYAKMFETVPFFILKAVTVIFPARTQLAVTCALEHFTALLSDQLLRNPHFEKHAHPVYAKLWIWHAIEETEHKAVCFDVYQLFCGGILGYIERCIVMIMTSLIFFSVVLFGFLAAALLGSANSRKAHQLAVAKSNKISLQRCKNIISDYYAAFFAEGAVLNGILKPYFAYYRPSFHPWQHDNSALLQRRKNDFEYGVFSDSAYEQLPKQECVL